MTRAGAGAPGDAVLVEHRLAPRDDATRRRLAELLADVEMPDAARASPDPPPPESPPVVPPLPRVPRVHWWRRTGVARKLNLAFGSLLGVAIGLMMPAVVIVTTLTAGWAFAPLPVIVVALLIALGWARRRRDKPVPSLLSEPVFDGPAEGTRPALPAPRAGVDPPVEPLLTPSWTTGIITAALAIERHDGPLDVDRLVDSLARLRLPDRLPRRRRRTVAAGAQVIVDFSEDMLPLRDDVLAILPRLRRVLGDDRVSVLRCAGRPLTQIGPGRRDIWGPYTPPQVRQPVLALTNFGLSDPSAFGDDHDEWVQLARVLRQRDCPLIAFVPNRAARVPARVRRHISVVEWDRTTTAASARRAVRG